MTIRFCVFAPGSMALLCLLTIACGPIQSGDLGFDEATASSERVVAPLSTQLAQGTFPIASDSQDFVVHERPDFGIALRTPENWRVTVVQGERRAGLEIKYSTGGGLPFFGLLIHQEDRQSALSNLRNGANLMGLTRPHQVEEREAVLGGVQTIIVQWQAAMPDDELPVTVVGAAYATHHDGGYTLVLMVISDAKAEQYQDAILEMMATLKPLDPPETATPRVASSWPSLASPHVEGDDGKNDAAVVVAIEDYLVAPDIPGARDNGNDWFSYLTRTRGVPTANIRRLANNQATLEEMKDAVSATTRAVGPGGTVWFVFIGHGAPGEGGRDGYLVGADAQQTARSLKARSLSRTWLLDKLSSHDAVVVLDACFSGLTNGGPLVPGLQPFVPVRGATTGKVLVLTAASGGEFAGPLPGANRPAFSYLVLGGLRGWADADKDGSVTAGEVTAYTRDVLARLARDRVQTPTLVGNGNHILSTSAAEPGPALDAFAR